MTLDETPKRGVLGPRDVSATVWQKGPAHYNALHPTELSPKETTRLIALMPCLREQIALRRLLVAYKNELTAEDKLLSPDDGAPMASSPTWDMSNARLAVNKVLKKNWVGKGPKYALLAFGRRFQLWEVVPDPKKLNERR